MDIEYGRLINDIRKQIKELNLRFEESPYGDKMIITVPPCKVSYVVDPHYIDNFYEDEKMYEEFLQMSIDQIKTFKEQNIKNK